MIHIMLEASLPDHTLAGMRDLLSPERLPEAVRGHLEEPAATGLCAGPARGGKACWVPCWISLRGPDHRHPDVVKALRAVRAAVVEAARQGGVSLHAVPAAVQWGETYQRVRDVADALELPAP